MSSLATNLVANAFHCSEGILFVGISIWSETDLANWQVMILWWVTILQPCRHGFIAVHIPRSLHVSGTNQTLERSHSQFDFWNLVSCLNMWGEEQGIKMLCGPTWSGTPFFLPVNCLVHAHFLKINWTTYILLMNELWASVKWVLFQSCHLALQEDYFLVFPYNVKQIIIISLLLL